MKHPCHRLRLAAGAAACAALVLLSTTGARAAGRQILSGHIHPDISRLTPIGRLDETNRLRLAIGLPIQNQTALDAILRELYDPASPNYRHFLTPADFTQQFGPAQDDYVSVANFASSNHLTITATHSNRTILDVEGSVADIEKAFHIKLQRYNHPSQHRVFHAPDTEPSVDLDVPILRVSGLSDYFKPLPKSIIKPISHNGTAKPNQTGSGPSGTFMGYDFRDAYAPDVTLTGAGQKVALLEFDGYYASDILSYEVQANLPQVPLTNILLDGVTGAPLTMDGNGEVSLDIEMVACMAPGIGQIMVYEGNFPDDVLNQIATDDAARQIGCSWGWEPQDPIVDQIFKQYATQGQTFLNASGDSGTECGTNVMAPSDDPFITQVGGTTLTTTGPLGSWVSDVVWSWFATGEGDAASTGGYSSTYSIPTWQQGIDMTTNGGSTTFRNYPDVALTADNVYVVYDQNQSGAFGGTSCAAPLWAAFIALVNQQAATYNETPVGFLCPSLYPLAKSSSYNLILHDVVSGNNTNYTYPTQFFACQGYDLCTGWGTPTGKNLINALAPLMNLPALFVLTNSISGGNGNGVIDYDECNNLTFVITNEGAVTATSIQGILSSATPGAIIAQSTVSFPNLAPGLAAASTTPFTISTEPSFVCGTPINLVLILKCAQTIQTNFIQIPSGIVGTPDVISNSTPITVPQGDLTGIFSTLTVSNLQAADKISVSVYAQVTYAEGLTMRLISPGGESILLTTYPDGYLGANYGAGCSPSSETTFDDSSSTAITAGSAPFVGTYRPIQPLSNLLPLYGTNLNGVWQLNVVNQFQGNPATLECWSLNVTPYVCQDGGGQCPGSDLSITMSASPNPVIVNSNVVYTLNVSNAGPSSADTVIISQSLPSGFGFVTTSNYPAQATISGANLTLSIGSLPVYGTAAVCVVAIPTVPGLATSVATVGSTSPDPNPNNNTASASTLVTLPTADLAVSMTASPTSVMQGGQVTFSINIANNGPFTATDVVLTNALPANVNYISFTLSQGSMDIPGVLFELGALPPGSNALIAITVSPTTTGNITDSAQVSLSPLETDPVSLNNSASATVTVGPSADLAIYASVSPVSVVAGLNYTYVAALMNNGPNAANNIVLRQTIPGGTSSNAATFVSSTLAGFTVTNGIVTWTIGTMPNGATMLITNIFKSPSIQSGGNPVPLYSTFSVFGQPGDPNTNNNIVTVSNLAETPTITIVPASANLLLQNGSPPTNGAVNPGQTVQVELFLQNMGNISTYNLVATLQPTGGVTLPSASQSYGALAPGASPVGQPFTFTANSAFGGTVVAALSLSDGSTNLGTVSFNFYMPVVQTFWNTNPIYIPASQFVPYPDSGPASPYPSIIQVSNVTGYVSKVSVTLSNLTHSYPNDIGMLLAGPVTNVVLMDDAVAFSSASAVTVTFDSTASTILPNDGALPAGVCQPADYNPNDVFTNAFAPPSFTNAITHPYATNLGSFNGSSANGVWALYIHDDSQGDAGGISNGWAVTITSIIPVNPTNSLAAAITASTNQVSLGNQITYLLNVTNQGAATVAGFLTNVIPAGLSFVSATGNYFQTGQTILYNLGNLSPGAAITITNVDVAIAAGQQTNTINAGLASATFNINGNSASVITTVNPPIAGLAPAVSLTPNPAIVNSNVTCTLWVTNLGPGNALSVAGSFSLTNLQVVSISPSQGGASNINGAVQCSLGTIPNGDFATVVITATTTNIGTFTNTWTVTTTSDNTNASNNSASAVMTVAFPAPVIAAAGATLLSQGLASPNGVINSNKTVAVAFTLANIGAGPTTNLIATLQPGNGVTPVTTSQSYGAIPPGGSASQPFSFTVNGAPGAAVTATLSLSDNGNSLGSVSFQFMIPASGNYTNSTSIIIPQYGAGSPYPSEILVSGMTNLHGASLLVGKVTATLNGFAHTFPHDVNVLLSSPSGQELIIMGHTGGPYGVSNLTFSFDDAATQQLPSAQLASGRFLPTDYPPVDLFPNLPPASGADALALFNGTIANGVWSLYVYDDTPGDAGLISGGWTLGLTAINTLLAAGMTDSPEPVFGGNYLNYQIIVTNLGPDIAGNVVITDTLPATVTFFSATVSQGAVTNIGNTVICGLGSISNGATAAASIRVITGAAGTIVNTATVSAAGSALYLAQTSTVNSTTVANPFQPSLQAANLSGALQLTLQGETNQNYAIQTSPDLLAWSSVFTNTASSGAGSFVYTNALTNGPARFYRAIHLP